MSEEKDVKEVKGRAKGGVALAKKMTKKQLTARASKAAAARWAGGPVLKATHGSADHPLKIGEIEIPCYVLEDGTRVLSQRGFFSGVGMSLGSSRTGDARHIALLETEGVKPYVNNDLLPMLRSPIRFQNPLGGGIVFGYPATVLPDYCDAILAARKAGTLPPRQSHIADMCEILVRGFARVGIIALIDEATGFERDKAKDSLAQILEAFIAKELQPWLRTFPADFYEEMFRLRGLPYPTLGGKRPQYFGVFTNNIVYDRIAPGVLEELQNGVPRNESGRPTAKYFQKLTQNTGYPKLREHLGSVVTLMKLSTNWDDFMAKLDRFHPKFDLDNEAEQRVQADWLEEEGV
jgi:hypothetical protein